MVGGGDGDYLDHLLHRTHVGELMPLDLGGQSVSILMKYDTMFVKSPLVKENKGEVHPGIWHFNASNISRPGIK